MPMTKDSLHTSDRATRRQVGKEEEPFLEFDLSKEIERLKGDDPWRSGRNARTLIKTPDLRVVLTVLRATMRLQEHRVSGTATILTVSGHTCVHAGGKRFDLPEGHLLSLKGNSPHDVEALTDSTILLTISWGNN